MRQLRGALIRLRSRRRDGERSSQWWAYVGSFGDDFFSDDDD